MSNNIKEWANRRDVIRCLDYYMNGIVVFIIGLTIGLIIGSECASVRKLIYP